MMTDLYELVQKEAHARGSLYDGGRDAMLAGNLEREFLCRQSVDIHQHYAVAPFGQLQGVAAPHTRSRPGDDSIFHVL